ncbi:hypothetical protein M3Y95_00435200 [Aphelenchoides besseyi]|nr:hypothetical protein M3Y95_00435200 [Aphelenchoides besseyi]
MDFDGGSIQNELARHVEFLSKILWAELIPRRISLRRLTIRLVVGDCKIGIYDIAFKPDGSQLLVAADNRVLVYDPNDGTLVTSLKGHKDLVYAVAFSSTGDRFASGSLDKTVIVWSDQHEGLLKYTHSDAVQCLAFSPVSMTLLSCSMSDFGIWGQNEKNVSKQKVNSRCTCCAWSNDGQYYAIGMWDGSVSVRAITSGSTAEEVGHIERPGSEPVWSLSFALPKAAHSPEMLAVVDWNQSVGFYTFDDGGRPTHRTDKTLNYDPTVIEYFNNGQFLLMGGSNKQLTIHTRDGNELGVMAQADSWIWAAKSRPNQATNNVTVAIACVDGTLACYQLMFSTVHSLHKDIYAYRDMLTDVVVQHLGRQRSIRIRCNNLVRKVAVYHNRLAIQLADKILIYRQASGEKEGEQVEYKLMDRINQNLECSLLVVTAHHVILCQDRRLQCLDHKGQKQREWSTETMIRYIKVVGGPPGREAILLGLRNGVVNKIFVDNPFPVEVIRLKSAIRCLDVSLSKRKLATVDENNVCMIFDTITKDLISQEPNVSSVAFNLENEELICFSGQSNLSVKARSFVPYQQHIDGFVVGFTGRRFHCLHAYSMSTNELPLTSQLLQYLDIKAYKLIESRECLRVFDFSDAYELASLGVTEKDWKLLGLEALENMEFQVAKKSFYRIKDCRSLLLINEVEDMKACGKSKEVIRAYIYAYSKRFREASHLLQEAGAEQNALEMFSDLRMFDQAQEFLAEASEETQKSLLRRKAEWAHNANDLELAAEMLMASGDYDKAIKIIINNDWIEKVLQLANRLDRSDSNLIREIGAYLAEKGEFTVAANLYTQIGDVRSIAMMHANAEHWEDAFAIVERHQTLAPDVYLPYARWLSEKDMFDEAQIAYGKAGYDNEAFDVLQQLAEKAVLESRFMDASYYFRIMARTYLAKVYASESEKSIKKRINEAIEKADVYYVYDAIFRYVMEPFTEKAIDVLFNMSRFLALKPRIDGVSQVNVLFTLSKLSKSSNNFKTTREALTRLRKYRVPAKFQSVVDISSLEIRAKPYSDVDEFLPVCYSCGTTNPILGGHTCVHCNADFIYSFLSFDVLPIIEFALVDGLTDEEAEGLIKAEPPMSSEPLTASLLLSQHRNRDKQGMLLLDGETLLSLESGHVFVCRPVDWLSTRYYLKVITEIAVVKCDECCRFFNADDFQMAVLQNGTCPVCRTKIQLYDAQREVYDDEGFND